MLTTKKYILVAIDDGHGQETAGKRTPAFSDGHTMKENGFNERVAVYLEVALKRCGFDVLMVAPEDLDTPLTTRVWRANEKNADCYISIHANAFGNNWNDANGIESIVYEKVMPDSETYRFAKGIHDALIRATGRRDRGIKRSADLFVLKNTHMHAVLLECGFMTNRQEAVLLESDDYRRECAEAICRGVCAFYGRTYVEAKKMERYQKLDDIPGWGQELIGEMVKRDCLGDEEKMDLSKDMLRGMVLMERLRKAREAER